MIIQFCAPVWKWFEEAAKVSSVMAPQAEFETYWTAPRREMIDPVKEVKGLEASVRAGFTSWQDVVREMGGDPDVLRTEMAEDMQAFDAIGSKPSSDPRYDPKRQDNTKDGADGADGNDT